MGWYRLDLLEATPHFNKNYFMLPDENEGALSKYTNCGISHKLKSFSRQLITVEKYMMGHGKANRNLEYSSINTSKYLLCDKLGGDPLQSTLICSKDFDALMRLLSSLCQRMLKFGTNAA